MSDPQTPVFHAKDYGAKFTGPGFDDTAAIKACIAAAAANVTSPAWNRTGGIVQLPAGAAIVSSRIDVPGSIWLRGAGPGLTELYTDWGTNTDPIVYLTPTNMMAKVSDLAIRVGPAKGPTCHGIYVEPGPWAWHELGGGITEIERVVVESAGGHGVVLNGVENRLRDVYSAHCAGSGFVLPQGASDNLLSNCTADTNQDQGFTMNSPNHKFSNCKAFGNKRSGFNVMGQRNMFSSCEAQDNGGSGFNDIGDNMYAACLADTNGQALVRDKQFGFHLNGGSTVSGCVALNRYGASQTYGYKLQKYNGVYPQVFGTSRLPGIAHVHPDSVGNINVNNLRGAQPVAYAATVKPDPYQGGTVILGELTADVTVNAPTSGVFQGMELSFRFLQDAVGGRTVTWDPAYTGAAAIDPAANAVTMMSFVYDGLKWRRR